MVWVPKGFLVKTNIQGPKKIWVPKSKYDYMNDGLLEAKLIIDSGYSKHMAGDASKFIHISPKDSEYVIYGDNKQRALDQQAQQVISNIPKYHLSLIDYFWLFLPMIVNF